MVEFRLSAPPFNTRLAQKSARVKTFISAIGAAYNMPAYGEVLLALGQHSLARESAIPYTLGVDELVVQRAGAKWKIICNWLATVECQYPDAKVVATTGSIFITAALKFVAEHKSTLTIDRHRRELLEPYLGADWPTRSENLHAGKFLRLFGASDALLDTFATATVMDRSGQPTALINDARWVANFISLFKPTTEFKRGAVSDILNFAAMFSGLSFVSPLTDRDSLRALQAFNEHAVDLQRVREAFFDMEPDDVAVMTFVRRRCKDAIIIRVYPSEEIARRGEQFLSTRLPRTGDSILIDPLLENASVLADIYGGTK